MTAPREGSSKDNGGACHPVPQTLMGPVNGWQSLMALVIVASVLVSVVLATGSVESGLAAAAPLLALLR
jgi:hypothetical protein